MKLELVKSNKTVVLEELDKLANPVEPIETGVDVVDTETAEEDTEKINKEVNKRIKDIEKNALAVKGEDHAEGPKLVKESKEFKKEERKELGAFIRKLKEDKIKHTVKRSTTEGYRYLVEYLKEEVLKEDDREPIDLEALEFYVKNWSEGDNVTVTADLLNVLEQALEMAKKHGIKEESLKEEKFVLKLKDANDKYLCFGNEKYFLGYKEFALKSNDELEAKKYIELYNKTNDENLSLDNFEKIDINVLFNESKEEHEEEESESEGNEEECEEGKCSLVVSGNENLEKDAAEVGLPVPLEVFPDNMGINLDSVETIEWEKFEDGQLKELEIKFVPATKEEKKEQGQPESEEDAEEFISKVEAGIVEEDKVVENLEESIDTSKEVWEGWTVQDFIDELEPSFEMIVKKKSFRKPFNNKEELKKWCTEEQPYYKKPIPEVVEYFDKKIKECGGYEKLGEGFISGAEKLSFEELAALEEGLFRELKNVGIYPEDGTFSNSSNHLADLELTLLIDGDWKHDHLAAEKIVEKFCKENGLSIVKHEADEVGHSDSDWYEAEHRWYLIKDVDGKMDDTIARLKTMFAPKDDEEEEVNESLKEAHRDDAEVVELTHEIQKDIERLNDLGINGLDEKDSLEEEKLPEKEIINPADVEEDDIGWFTGE